MTNPWADMERTARDIRNARKRLALALDTGRAVTRTAASEHGLSEVQIARGLGVNRTTVRSWLGKER